MTENWKHVVDNGKICEALLTDLSKLFDCVCYDLLIAKLNAYGLPLSDLKTHIKTHIAYEKELYLEFHKDRF